MQSALHVQQYAATCDISDRAMRKSSLVAMRCRTCAGNAEGFSITPFTAGHLLGGCAWRITTPGDEDIVYAVHYNHRKQARATLVCNHGAREHS